MRNASLVLVVALLFAGGCGGTAPDESASLDSLRRSEGSHDETPAACHLSVRERSFDSIVAGTSRTYEVHLVNDGERPCAISDVVLERGRDVVRLEAVEDRTLEAGATLVLHVAYSPVEPGVVEPSLHMRANDGVFEQGLRFEAVAAPEEHDACAFVTPERVAFEGRALGCGTEERFVVVHNQCDRVIRVVEAELGENPAFTLGGSDGRAEIPPGGEMRIVVRFSPVRPGESTGRLLIRVDGMAGFEVPLVGHTIDGVPVRDVFHATAGQRLFELSQRPVRAGERAVEGSIELHVDHVLVRPMAEGERTWGYGEVRNLVEFVMGRGPDEGAEVVIEYLACRR